MRRIILASLALAACSKKDAPPQATDKVTEGAPTLPTAPVATPQHLTLPPLPAADAIEPPSREILPGMTVAEARQHGATGDSTMLLDWRPDIEVGIDDKTGLVTDLQVGFSKAGWEAQQKKWGEPNFGEDTWMGAAWIASLNGCNGSAPTECGVTFRRNPLPLLGSTPRPPLGLHTLKAGMTPAQVKAATGLALEDRSGMELGYSLRIGADYSGDELEAVILDAIDGDDDQWKALLSKQWGPPVDLAGDTVWLNTKDHWVAQLGAYGDTVRFMPMATMSEFLARDGDASLLAIARASLGQAPGSLKVPHYDAKADAFTFPPSELSLHAPEVVFGTDEKDLVSEVRIWLHAEGEHPVQDLEKLVTAAWGPIKTVKDADDNEIRQLEVEGLKGTVEDDGQTLRITLHR